MTARVVPEWTKVECDAPLIYYGVKTGIKDKEEANKSMHDNVVKLIYYIIYKFRTQCVGILPTGEITITNGDVVTKGTRREMFENVIMCRCLAAFSHACVNLSKYDPKLPYTDHELTMLYMFIAVGLADYEKYKDAFNKYMIDFIAKAQQDVDKPSVSKLYNKFLKEGNTDEFVTTSCKRLINLIANDFDFYVSFKLDSSYLYEVVDKACKEVAPHLYKN